MEFDKVEHDIIKFWSEYRLHEKIIESRFSNQKWEFLDGPPFVNGVPHHGHLLVSSIKDTMARYMSQKGFGISYQIGFDCHGLPLEQEAEKKVGKVSPNDSIERLSEFNDQCRSIISNCSEIWYDKLGRLGRQFDKSQTYYTSDFKFMQSLWWSFKTLWDQGLIYCSKKVMPYSPLCETPLSNFEANSNYQERTDISVYVKFKLVDSDECVLIWTTTPWSLFANQGICVNPSLTYQLIELTTNNSVEKIWLCQEAVERLCIGEFSSFQVIKSVLGSELVGLYYEPIFKLDSNNNFQNYKIYADTYVQNTTGTGLVHLAPLFGEDDMRVMKSNGYLDEYLPSSLVDSQIKFTIDFLLNNDTNIKGKFVMDTSTDIVIYLKNNKHAIRSEKIKHSYPYCWRTDYPLVYLATDAWFMNVQKIIPELIENNKKIHWYPENVGTERFANWIKDSPDWCLSRNRIWGTPIPVWVSETNKNDMICIETVEQLEKLSGKKINDLHLDKIGDITFTIGSSTYRRTFGVLDCWFESGMAGLARYGYPECVGKSYPVDFIAESVDQTRGWFYTLNVLSTALNHEPAFKKVIVSGLILAADGKKMSKRLGNYTQPDNIIEKYGADILRLYLIGSPASKAESFCFKDSDLAEITRKLLPYYNAHLFLKECLTNASNVFSNLDWLGEYIKPNKSNNKIDLWITNKFMEFSKNIYTHMEKLELTHVPHLIYQFFDNLCNVFVKLSRERMKCLHTEQDCKESLGTLQMILSKTNIVLGPFIPHIAEYFNMQLHNIVHNSYDNYISVHLHTINIDDSINYQLDETILNGFYSVNDFLETIRSLRQQHNKPIFYPLKMVELYTPSQNISEFEDIVCNELNIKKLIIKTTDDLPKTYRALRGSLGKIFKKEANQYVKLIESGNVTWEGCSPDYYTFEYNIEEKPGMVGAKFNYLDSSNKLNQSVVYLNIETSEQSDMEAEVNNIRRQVNILRKDMGLKLFNKVRVIFETNEYWSHINEELMELLSGRLVASIHFEEKLDDFKLIETFNGKELKVKIDVI